MSDPVLIDVSGQREIHCAGWIIADADTVIENGCIEVENGRIKSIGKNLSGGKRIDHGPGVIMPPLVNCHLHLELSALKNMLPFDQGFGTWVSMLLEKREVLGEENLIKGAAKASRELPETGTLYVGDISTLNITGPILETSKLKGICFNEFLGTRVETEEWRAKKQEKISYSLAGHAPHTTSPEVLTALKKKAAGAGLPFSIHLAESGDESEFLRDRKGSWADFLTSRGIDFSSWGGKGLTPIAYAAELGLLDELTLAVHLLDADKKDIMMFAESKARICLCPRSNRNLHGRLPDIKSILDCGIEPGLGTDSLASCDSLSILDEMAFVKRNYPDLSSREIFRMGTINGAKALGLLDETGSLAPGKRACFLSLPVEAGNQKTLFRKIINNE